MQKLFPAFSKSLFLCITVALSCSVKKSNPAEALQILSSTRLSLRSLATKAKVTLRDPHLARSRYLPHFIDSFPDQELGGGLSLACPTMCVLTVAIAPIEPLSVMFSGCSYCLSSTSDLP